MNDILNISNGDSAVDLMKQAEVAGDFLPWRDVLHEGPVPNGLSLEELSGVRAEYISKQGWGALDEVNHSFIQRDNTLKSASQYRKVILWFEHDLYDQLQILQILDWLNEHGSADTELSMICTDQYLGMLTPNKIPGLFEHEKVVNSAQLILASKAWAAFRAEQPREWHALLTQDTTALPFLKGAVVRLLQEYPSKRNGLSRTAYQALLVVSTGVTNPAEVFRRYQKSEERRFLGDSSFWTVLKQLITADPALLDLIGADELTLPAGPDQILSLTEAGKAVLAGKRDALGAMQIDRWHGGVHLTQAHLWRWETTGSELRMIPE